jgi:hypothetical protein
VLRKPDLAHNHAPPARWGSTVKGITDPKDFAEALKDAHYSTNPDFDTLVSDTINGILSRINCPQLKKN